MDWGGWATFGFGATVALTAVLVAAQLGGFTRMDIPMMLGTMLGLDPLTYIPNPVTPSIGGGTSVLMNQLTTLGATLTSEDIKAKGQFGFVGINVDGGAGQDANVKVTAALVSHPPVVPAFAYRFDTADRSIVISGDTARSDNLIALAAQPNSRDFKARRIAALYGAKERGRNRVEVAP